MPEQAGGVDDAAQTRAVPPTTTTASPKRPRRRYDRVAILDYIATYQQTHNGRSPSERRIQSALHMPASSTVHYAIRDLAADGLLVITPIEPHNTPDLTITDVGHERLAAWRQQKGADDV